MPAARVRLRNKKQKSRTSVFDQIEADIQADSGNKPKKGPKKKSGNPEAKKRNFDDAVKKFWTPQVEAEFGQAFERFSSNGKIESYGFVQAWINCDMEANGSNETMEEVFKKLDILKKNQIDKRKYMIGVKNQILKVTAEMNSYEQSRQAKAYRHRSHRYRLYITPQRSRWFCSGSELPGGCRNVLQKDGWIPDPSIDCYACRRTSHKLCQECYQDKTRKAEGKEKSHGLIDLEALRTEYDLGSEKSEEELLKFVFTMYDGDGSGEIDAEEFRAAFQVLGADLSKREMSKLFSDMDHDGSGTISFDEFKNFVLEEEARTLQKHKHQEQMFYVKKAIELETPTLEMRKVLINEHDVSPEINFEEFIEELYREAMSADITYGNDSDEDEIIDEDLYDWAAVKTVILLENLDVIDLIGRKCLLYMGGRRVVGKVIDVPADEHVIIRCKGHADPYAVMIHDDEFQINKKETKSQTVRRLAETGLEIHDIADMMNLEIELVERLLDDEDVFEDEDDGDLYVQKRDEKWPERAQMDAEVRKAWRVGSELEVFSANLHEWFRGKVTEVYSSNFGEDELEVAYTRKGQPVGKIVKRFQSVTRPIGFEEQALNIEALLDKNIKNGWYLTLDDAYNFFTDYPTSLVSLIYQQKQDEFEKLKEDLVSIGNNNQDYYSKHGFGCLAISESGLICTGSMDRNIRLFRNRKDDHGKKQVFPLSYFSCGSGIQSIDVSRNGRIVAAGLFDARVEFWDVLKSRHYLQDNAVVKMHSHWIITHIKFSRDNKQLIVAGGRGDRAVRVFDIRTQKQIRSFPVSDDAIDGFSVSHDGKNIVTTCQDRRVRLYDFNSGTFVQQWQYGKQFESQNKSLVQFYHDSNSRFVSSCDNKLGFFEVGYESPIEEEQFSNKVVTAMDLKGDMLAIGMSNGDISLFETSNFHPKLMKRDVAEDRDKITGIKWYDEFTYVSVSGDSKIEVNSYPEEVEY